MANQVKFRFYEEILSESQASVFNGNLRRAVLELAIACELATKQSFFGEASRAGLAFEYLEDKGRVNVKVLDLITGVAVQVIGQSFKDFDKNAYIDIDHLFRCRNKVAHRGEPKFKDDTGKEYEISEEILQRWWDSAEKLFRWLDSF
ncbi:hypothetical protein JOY44_07075 [Phormidium sp. CLA17]|uniref:hypothetical protein n=1 Tax=Leptolyngbya sp. Cla-17 TaxID=2803751 RepID=UPI001492F14C|nr:hypothetical protein [Leptolyngbya sp. Cla-17]MBM0741382.1 hypothetical protein [Leptolyngbya sp. Cla-17]